ncbi:MAG TPA: SDR family oxidoreductase, partial [Kofleriaceae bacterium]|nr:SDR family oxidoreductase [Kofleriaceae bacterium]
MAISDDDLDACIRVLDALVEDRTRLADVDEPKAIRILKAAGIVSRPDRAMRKQLAKVMRRRDRAAVRAHDAKVVSTSLNRTARRSSSFVLPGSTVLPGSVPLLPEDAPRELLRPRSCYICKTEYRRVHPFYDSMCPPCAELNLQKRNQTARLDGRYALITGARIKIGYQAALMMLRAGATVLATTRFPRDAAARYAEEPDFAVWRDRLHVYGIDLRMAPEVERFAQTLCATLPRLDILVNNAAQTVRRPAAFYQHLVEEEARPLPPGLQPLLSAPAPPSALAARSAKEDADFPLGQFDLDKQQVDLRTVNSWRLTLSEVPTSELLEVQLVNAVAPFILVSKLKAL